MIDHGCVCEEAKRDDGGCYYVDPNESHDSSLPAAALNADRLKQQ